jgi:isoquinoline 1-oxidoreductase subunit beta
MKEIRPMTQMSSATKLTRRTMLKATAAAGGALVLTVSIPRLNAALAAEPPADFALNAFMRIDPDGKVTFTIPQVEMGQGIYTALSMILAEELDAPFDHVTAVAAPPNDKLYANPLLGFQVTGGSTSVRAFWKPMRLAGATARAMLVQAAAAKWSVDPSSCRTENGEVFHDASAQKAAYGQLVQAAAALTPPQDPPLKPATDFKLIGKSLKRLDTPDKVNGKAVYGIDALPPGVKIATLASCPVFGGKVAHVNDERAKTVTGVRQVIVLDDLAITCGRPRRASAPSTSPGTKDRTPRCQRPTS